MKISKRLVLTVLSMILMVNLFSSAIGEEVKTWDCPQCGRKGNTGNFCGECGCKAPKEEVKTWDCSMCGRTGNTGVYCSACGNPAPVDEAGEVNDASWMKAPAWPDTMFAFNMSVDEMDQRVKELLQKATGWDEASFPQTIDEFPLFPENLSDIYDYIFHLEKSLSLSRNDKFTWKTGLKGVFNSIAQGNNSLSLECRKNGAVISGGISNLQTDDSYIFSFENDYSFGKWSPEDLFLIGLQADWYRSSEYFAETLNIDYRVDKEVLTGEARVKIMIHYPASGYDIEWSRGYGEYYQGVGEDIIHILITDDVSRRQYDAVYNPETGQRTWFKLFQWK